MFLIRGSLAVGLALALTTAAFAAPTVRRGTSRHGIEGTVVQVHRDRANGRAGWIKIRRRHHYGYARRGSNSVAATLGRNRFRRGSRTTTVPINSTTRFERLQRGANGMRGTRTTFQAVHSREYVRIFPGSGRARAAREVVILPRYSNRSGTRHASGLRRGAFYGRRYGHHHRYVYRRHPLVHSRVLYRHARRHHSQINHTAARRAVVRRPVRHTLIHGRAASQHRQVHHRAAPHTVKHTTKHTAKHAAVKRPPAHKPTAKHVNPKPAHKSSANHRRPASHPHRKR